MQYKFTKNAKWCVNHVGVEFSEGQLISEEVVGKRVLQDMLSAGHVVPVSKDSGENKNDSDPNKELVEKKAVVLSAVKGLSKGEKKILKNKNAEEVNACLDEANKALEVLKSEEFNGDEEIELAIDFVEGFIERVSEHRSKLGE